MEHKTRNTCLLLLTALIWGSAFVAQRAGIEVIGPFTLNGLRSILAGIVLLPVIKVMDLQKKRQQENQGECVAELGKEEKAKERKTLIVGGICCGIALTLGSTLQQVGIVYTTAGKSGFITALYILIVPILGLFIKKKVGMKTWVGVVLALVGMYFLSMTDGFYISKGDFLVFLSAIAFAMHILVIDYFSPKADGVKLSCIQFWVCGIVCSILMMIFEKPEIGQVLAAWLPIVYAGVLSSGVGYTLQVVAQKGIDPTVASLIMSLESVFAALSGWLILHEQLSSREIFGCILVFVAIVLAQLPEKMRLTVKARQAGEHI